MNGLRSLVLSIFLLVVSVSSGRATTNADNLGDVRPDQDVILTWGWGVGGNSIGEKVLARRGDLNNDGTMDAISIGGTSVITDLSGTCTANPEVWACTLVINSFGVNEIVIKNISHANSFLVPGSNYTLIVPLRDIAGTTVKAYYASWRVLSNTSFSSDDKATRTLINQSYANLTQNLTTDFPFTWNLINTTDGCDSRCQQNISKNVTDNFTLFASDCHGTGAGLCINGHVAVLEDTALLRSLGVFVWLLIIAVMSHVTRMNRAILVVLALLPIIYVLGNLAAFEPEMLIAILIGCTAVFIALAFPQETPDRA